MTLKQRIAAVITAFTMLLGLGGITAVSLASPATAAVDHVTGDTCVTANSHYTVWYTAHWFIDGLGRYSLRYTDTEYMKDGSPYNWGAAHNETHRWNGTARNGWSGDPIASQPVTYNDAYLSTNYIGQQYVDFTSSGSPGGVKLTCSGHVDAIQ